MSRMLMLTSEILFANYKSWGTYFMKNSKHSKDSFLTLLNEIVRLLEVFATTSGTLKCFFNIEKFPVAQNQ